MSPAWTKAKAERAERRIGRPRQQRDEHGLIINRDGSRKWDTWQAWARSSNLDALAGDVAGRADLKTILASPSMRGAPAKAILAVNTTASGRG